MGVLSKPQKAGRAKKSESSSDVNAGKSVDEWMQMIMMKAQKEDKVEEVLSSDSDSSPRESHQGHTTGDDDQLAQPLPNPAQTEQEASGAKKGAASKNTKVASAEVSVERFKKVDENRVSWMNHAKKLEVLHKEADESNKSLGGALEKAKRKYRKYKASSEQAKKAVETAEAKYAAEANKASKAESEKVEAVEVMNKAEKISAALKKLTSTAISHLKDIGEEQTWCDIVKKVAGEGAEEKDEEAGKVLESDVNQLPTPMTGRPPPVFPPGLHDNSTDGKEVMDRPASPAAAGEKRKHAEMSSTSPAVVLKKDGSLDGRCKRARKLRRERELGAIETPKSEEDHDTDSEEGPAPKLPVIEEGADEDSMSDESSPKSPGLMLPPQGSLNKTEQAIAGELNTIKDAEAKMEAIDKDLVNVKSKIAEVEEKERILLQEVEAEEMMTNDDISDDTEDEKEASPCPASSSHESSKICTKQNIKNRISSFFSTSSLFYKSENDTSTARFRRLSIWPEIRKEFEVQHGWELKGVSARNIVQRLNLSRESFPRVTKNGGIRLSFHEYTEAVTDTLKFARNEKLGKILEVERSRAPTAIDLARCMPENAPELAKSVKHCKNRQLWTSFLDKAKPVPVADNVTGIAKRRLIAETNRQVAATLELVATEIGTHSKMVQRYLGVEGPVPAATVSQVRLGRAMAAIKQSMLVVKKGITPDSARQRANTFLRFKAWHETFVLDGEASWLHPRPLDVKDYLTERRKDGDTCPSSDFESLNWFAKTCGFDFPSRKEIPNFAATVAKQDKKILSDDEIDQLIEEGKWFPKRCSWTPYDIVQLEKRAVEKGCEISSFTLVMVWSTIRPTHIGLSTIEDIDLRNRVIKFHCAAGKQHGPLNAFKFQCTLQSISQEERQWWTPLLKALKRRDRREHDFLFMKKNGQPMNANEITDAIRKVCRNWLPEYEVMRRTARSSRYFTNSTAGSCAVGEEHTVTAGFWKDSRDVGNQSRSMPSTYDDNRLVKNEFLRTMIAQYLTEYNQEEGDDFKTWDATSMMRFMARRMNILKGQKGSLIKRFWG